MIESKTSTTHCCFCSMQCAMDITVDGTAEGGHPPALTVKPNKSFPVATGRLCQKGLNSHQHAIHPSRITIPLVRSDAPGAERWTPIEWPEAIDRIGEAIERIQASRGRNAVGVYGGGSLTNEVCYLLGKFARVALRTKYIDYNGRYCMSSAATAAKRAFGLDRGMTMPLDEIPNAEAIILSGTNIAECQPTMMPYLLQAKKNGAFIAVIDPRQTMTAKIADVHIPLQPGFDSVLVNGLLRIILKEGLYDRRFVETRTEGLVELIGAVEHYDETYVEALTGVLPETLRTVARKFAKADTGIVLTARGLEQQINGVENTLNYMNLSLVTGKIGRPGCGFGAVTGQGNGQGGREHGQKADQLPGYRSIEDDEARAHIASVWGISPEELPGKGVSAFEMIQKIDQGEIAALIVLGSNPIVSSPNADFAEQALRKLELLVVIDMFETETAAFADYFLPSASFLENEGSLTNLEGRVFHRPQVWDPPGGAKRDHEILYLLAERLGRGNDFRYDAIEDVFRELARASAGGDADYGGLSYGKLREAGGVFWPCPDPSHPGTPMLFADRFHTASGRAALHGIEPKMPAEPIDDDYPYILTTGRLGNHYLSGAQTRRSPNLDAKAPVPVAELHPAAAERLGLTLTDKLKIESRRGSIVLNVKLTPGIHKKAVFVPFHWGGEQSINRLTIDALEPSCKMPEFKLCAVRLSKA